jgi:hypothetical protein
MSTCSAVAKTAKYKLHNYNIICGQNDDWNNLSLKLVVSALNKWQVSLYSWTLNKKSTNVSPNKKKKDYFQIWYRGSTILESVVASITNYANF